MGKGKRNKTKRKQRHAGARVAPSLDRRELASAVFGVDSCEQFRQLLANEPRILDDATIAALDAPQHAAGFALQFWRLQVLLREARTDPDGAWTRRQAWFEKAKEASVQMESQLRVARAAQERGSYDEAIGLAEAALPIAAQFGLGAIVLELHDLRGWALLRRTGDRAADVDNAIEAFELALQHSVRGDRAAALLDSLGGAHAQRPRGDRGENVEAAIAAQRQGLMELTDESGPEAVAIAQTNLAATLLSRERGERAESLQEAIELCQAALSYRSPERNAVDWAYTQLNLAAALESLAVLTEEDTAAALDAFGRVIDHRDRISEPWLVGWAFASIGRRHLLDSQPSAERQLAAYENDALDDLLDNRDRLERARTFLEQATQFIDGAGDPTFEGRVLRDLAAVYDGQGETDAALVAAERATLVLAAVGAPRDVVAAAFRLGGLRADRGEWEQAATAYRQAVAAADAGLDARLDDSAREREQREILSLHRRAAVALALNGQPVQAALALEGGRARALRTRLGVDAIDPELMSRLPGQLADAYTSTKARVADAPLGPAGAERRRELAEVLSVIRAQPGFEEFGRGVQLHQIAAAAARDWPLMYVNPTPNGTLLLTVIAGDESQVEVRVLDRPLGMELFGHLMIGRDFGDPDDADSEDVSYLLAITGHGDAPEYLPRAIAQTLSWVGEALARPISGELERHGARGVTFVLCGPIGAVPLGAASWTEDGQERRLVDDVIVQYAPSALVAASAKQRASNAHGPPQLLALADPDGTLEAAAPEVREIVRRFAPGASIVGMGHQATLPFLRDNAGGRTHVHLACHAAGGLFDRDEAVLALADGIVTVGDLTEIANLQPRLVVVSACQGAQSEIAGLPDEAVSIGAAFLAAGAACAIAALWPVHDAVTALLMVRLYEILGQEEEPAAALRSAQRWLRDLTEADRHAFESDHPRLRYELRRLADRPRDPARAEPFASQPATARPFAHPDYWAGFVALGG